MKTREQLIEEIEKLRVDFATKPFSICSSKILDLIVSACEELVIETDEGYQGEELGSVIQIDTLLENLKKLKSK